MIDITPENIQVAEMFWQKVRTITVSPKVRKIFNDLNPYIISSYEKNSQVKLICSKSLPVKLKDVYIQSFFECEGASKNPIDDNTLVSDIRDNKRVIIRGNGGSGKTFFLKKMWNDVFEEPEGKIPIILELRKVNSYVSTSLKELLFSSLGIEKHSDKLLFEELALDGRFIFLFDGFDEVVLEKRANLESQILSIEKKYSNCGIVVSSRPCEYFQSWIGFHIYDALPFEKTQISRLISKVPVDVVLKDRFLKSLDDKFFQEHREFLSNPLLALMMLMTFKDRAHGPSTITEFYENAFIALFNEHDAMKESLIRERPLNMLDFKRLFSAFSMYSYHKSKATFKETEFLDYLTNSKNFIRSKFVHTPDISIEQLKHEILESVNLMQVNGRDYSYIHRSFQEYFSAFFTISIGGSKTTKFLDILASNPSDKSFALAFELDQAIVEEQYFLKKITEYQEKLPNLFGNNPGSARYEKLHMLSFNMCFSGPVFNEIFEWNRVSINANPLDAEMYPSEFFRYLRTLHSIYPEFSVWEEVDQAVDNVVFRKEGIHSNDILTHACIKAGLNKKKLTKDINAYLIVNSDTIQICIDGKAFDFAPDDLAALELALDKLETIIKAALVSIRQVQENIRERHKYYSKSAEEIFFS